MRLPTAMVSDGLIAILLPGGLLSEADPLYTGQPSVIAGIQSQLRAGKPELKRLGFEVALAINFLERETSGVFLVGLTRAAVKHWRDALGSLQLRFTYEFLARVNTGLEDIVICDLPLARHQHQPRMIVSHRTGKKCQTRFRRLARSGEIELWRGETKFPRPHQIRLHAMECRLELPGETLYRQSPPLTWADFGGTGQIATFGPVLHLAEIVADGRLGLPRIRAHLPERLHRVWKCFD